MVGRAKANGGDGRAHTVVGAIEARLRREAQAIDVLDLLVDLVLEQHAVEADFRNTLGKNRIQLARIEILACNEPYPGKSSECRSTADI